MKKENKILTASSTITSGILTDLIYNEISTSHYQKQIINDIEIYVQIDELSSISKVLIIALIFISIWLILSIIVPRLLYLKKSISHKREHSLNTKEIMNSYIDIKEKVKSLSLLVSENELPEYKLLYSDDLTNCVNTLHSVFCSKLKKQQTTVRATFRTSISINTKGVRISSYEFLAVLSVINDIIEEVMSSGNIDCKQDKENLLAKLKEIKNIVPSQT